MDEYGNVEETLMVPTMSESQELGMKPVIGENNGEEEAAEERDSNHVEDDVVPAPHEPVTDKTYLESYYSANDMRHWNIYWAAHLSLPRLAAPPAILRDYVSDVILILPYLKISVLLRPCAYNLLTIAARDINPKFAAFIFLSTKKLSKF